MEKTTLEIVEWYINCR